MKTLEEILKNVTAGGQWEAEGRVLNALDKPGTAVAKALSDADAAYSARAARNFSALVRALDLMITAPDSEEAMRVARSSMAEALKD